MSSAMIFSCSFEARKVAADSPGDAAFAAAAPGSVRWMPTIASQTAAKPAQMRRAGQMNSRHRLRKKTRGGGWRSEGAA